MKAPVQVSFRGLARSEAVEFIVRKKVGMLERLCADIVSCHVVMSVERRHEQRGFPFGVLIQLSVPGGHLAVSRARDEDAYVALREGFDDMRRQLHDFLKQREERATRSSGIGSGSGIAAA
jgi:ribosomal subunit interface protein